MRCRNLKAISRAYGVSRLATERDFHAVDQAAKPKDERHCPTAKGSTSKVSAIRRCIPLLEMEMVGIDTKWTKIFLSTEHPEATTRQTVWLLGVYEESLSRMGP